MVKKGFCSRRLLLLLAMTGFAAACLFMLPYISKRIQEFEAAPVQMEYLDRGTVAMKTDEGIFLSWRLLGTEDYHSGFSIYRNGRQIAQVKDSTNYTDAAGSESDQYVVVLAEEPYGEGKTVSVWKEACLRIPLDIPRGGISADGEEYNYTANDATCADLDGDGEYEVILKWDPSNSFDSGAGAKNSGNVYIDAYKLNGEKLWRIDLGINISAGAHFTQMSAYDFDLDGKAELALKTAPGSLDGTGKYVSEASEIPAIRQTDNQADYREKIPTNQDSHGGRILSGDEFLTVFDGLTGEAIDTIYYPFPRGSIEEWGDSRGNRSERYLSSVAYLDGINPHLVVWRGYYAKTTAAAYRLESGKLIKRFSFDSSKYVFGNYNGQGNHNLIAADVDYDGRDELLCGSLVLDDDLTVLWCSGRGHGDAAHLADYDPLHRGMEYFSVHETAPYGMTVYDAATGKELFHLDADGDTGRGMMAHVGFTGGYYEIWAAKSHDRTIPDVVVGTYASYGGRDFLEERFPADSLNFRIFWDDDLYDELLDGDGTEGSSVQIIGKDGRIAAFPEALTGNGTKQNVCLTADLFGDWREEFVARSRDGKHLLIYTSSIPTGEKLYTLMHDRTYRMQVASQNSGYNQPPHLGYYVSNYSDVYDGRETACWIRTVHNGKEYIRNR